MADRIRFPSAPQIASTVRDGNYSLVPHISYGVSVAEDVGNIVENGIGVDKSERVFTVTIQLFYIDVTKINETIDSIITSITGTVNQDLNPGNEIDRTSDFDPEIVFLSQFDKRSEIKTIDVYSEIVKVKKQFLSTALTRLKTQIQQSVALNMAA